MLHRAFCSLGPVKLLCVYFGTDGEDLENVAPGGAAQLGDGLFIGRLSRAGKTASGTWDIMFGEWVRVCEQVCDLAGPSLRTTP